MTKYDGSQRQLTRKISKIIVVKIIASNNNLTERERREEKERNAQQPLLGRLKKKKKVKTEKEGKKDCQRVKQTINRRINSTVWSLKCGRVGMECGTN